MSSSDSFLFQVKKKPRPLLLQPAEDGSFMFINLSISSPSIHKPPAGAAPVSTMAGHRAVSCLNFDELSKKNEIKVIKGTKLNINCIQLSYPVSSFRVSVK